MGVLGRPIGRGGNGGTVCAKSNCSVSSSFAFSSIESSSNSSFFKGPSISLCVGLSGNGGRLVDNDEAEDDN